MLLVKIKVLYPEIAVRTDISLPLPLVEMTYLSAH